MITRATPDDLPALMELVAAFYIADKHPFDEAKVRRSLMPLLAGDEHGVVWLLAPEPAGYAVVTWGYSLESGGQEGLIDEIFVSPQSTGEGARLVHHIIQDCRQRGIVRMFLETERHNSRVRGFYKRAGFEEDDSIWMSRFL